MSPARRQARGEARRLEILRATLLLIRQGGVGAVTSRAVAQAAGVPLGSLSYYFTAKDDLLVQALLLLVEEEIARLQAIVTSLSETGDVDPQRAATAFEEVLREGEFSAIAQLELYVEAGRNAALQAAAARCIAAYEEAVAATLAAAGVEHAAGAAPLFVALADGLALRQIAAPEGAPRLADGLLALLRGMTGDPVTPRP